MKINKDRIIFLDIETNALKNPTKIHVVCAQDYKGNRYEFRNVLDSPARISEFLDFLRNYDFYCGHNFIDYDLCVALDSLIPGHPITYDKVIDTLVLSRLFKYDRPGGHSIYAWGERYGIKKEGAEIEDWSTITETMVSRCHSDVSICRKFFLSHEKYILSERWQRSIEIEHYTAYACAMMTRNGFGFDLEGAKELRAQIQALLDPIDAALAKSFKPKVKFIKEVTPRRTKSGTFNMNDFRWYEGDDLTIFTGGSFSRIEYTPFNPNSVRQVVERLNEAGWRPTEKTDGHKDFLKERPPKKGTPEYEKYLERKESFDKYGWKVSEENLKTLPDSAPAAAKDLAKRLLLASRLSDIDEWLALTERDENGEVSVHGSFSSIGAWTHRLSHSKPNLANVPVAKRSPKDTEFETLVNDLNDKMRSLWRARKGYRLVGTDADGLQMRVFAHIVNDERLIKALIDGRKEDKTDIHSLHQRFLGEVCKSRDVAKTFIYAWLLGAGTAKQAQVLECTFAEARGAEESFLNNYPSLKELKRSKIPADAARGFFEGLDGRLVACSSEHLMLAGYLQNGEAVIMKRACRQWQQILQKEKIPFRMVTWPHDEWQTEIPDDDDICEFVQQTQIQSIRDQARDLELNCPLDGSSAWGYDWHATH